jgi:2-keto-3-deoxy-L-rhamnonate aldolase RhmA
MKNIILEKAAKGIPSIGTFSHLKSSVMIDALAYTELDYIILDMEHAPLGTNEADELVALAAARGFSPVVRINTIERSAVLKALDSGAHGIIVPNLKTIEEAKQLVEWGKYAPEGERGFCPTRDVAWGAAPQFEGGMVSYMKYCNENTLILPQCETKECVEIVDEVAALPGIGGLFIGPMDLSINLGVPGQFDEPVFKEAVAKTVAACKKHGKLSMGFAGNADLANAYIKEGYSSVAYGVDIMMLQGAYAQALKDIDI